MLTPAQEGLAEPPQTAILFVQDDTPVFPNPPRYVVGTPNNATVTIIPANSLPTVTVVANGTASENGPTPATFTFTRTGNAIGDLFVFYQLPTGTGRALLGWDYTLSQMPPMVTIANGQTTAVLNLTPVQDSRYEGTETVELDLLPNANYLVGSPSSAIMSISDNDSPPPSNLMYTITAIGQPGPISLSWGMGINGATPAPTVVGMFQPVSGNQHVHGFSWLNGTLTDLGALESGGAAQSWALGVNDSGLVVGYATSDVGTFYPVTWSSGVIGVLATLGFGDNQATAISASGHIVGFCDNNFDTQRAVFWSDPSTPNDMGCLDRHNPPLKASYANGVNVDGRIVGKAMIEADNVSFHGFRTAGGVFFNIDPAKDDLGTLFGGVSFNSEADGINDLDEVVGGSATMSGQFHAYWKAGNTGINDGYVDLGVLSGDNYSVALAINTTGTTVGYSRNPSTGVQRAFVSYNDGIMHDLITKVSNPTGWTLATAQAVNASGWIVGWGYTYGYARAFVLAPNQ